MKKSQKLRNLLAESGIEKTPAEAKAMLKQVRNVFNLTEEEYETLKLFTDEDFREHATHHHVTLKEYKDVHNFLLEVGKRKFGD